MLTSQTTVCCPSSTRTRSLGWSLASRWLWGLKRQTTLMLLSSDRRWLEEEEEEEEEGVASVFYLPLL